MLLRHIGIESCRLSPGAETRDVVPHNLPLSFLEQSCDLLGSALAARDWDNCQALVVTLLVCDLTHTLTHARTHTHIHKVRTYASGKFGCVVFSGGVASIPKEREPQD